ncbi:V-type H+-transporting ATPase 54 kD subunit [Babesia microti strain RI]|uniref:V-type H+-transporting ATPase 54 kD subunit n=1 Tax=Babesia microti (strain RI) TaxID=1133968 RepID=A0A1N6LWD2_BABMR|nr:V-type H+-transporting ATPase 54 kD subunit [Babesia microti strain RI]SIO73185.1 V-type H+-transporting ATPase 54 kD subunit [Babesia microti strain RI]|eukprot:XP_021337293.1 V-type H+-transporting ATPase 54 kD subunit [Babesia microti strain RI]
MDSQHVHAIHKSQPKIINTPWDFWLERKFLSTEEVEMLKTFEALSSIEKTSRVNDKLFISVLKNALSSPNNDLIIYSLHTISDICRIDSSNYDIFLDIFEGNEIINLFTTLAKDKKGNVASKAFSFLSRVMSYNAGFTLSQVDELLDNMNSIELDLSAKSRLEIVCNLLKYDGYREIVFNKKGVPTLINKCLHDSNNADSQYHAVFCYWLLSFKPKFIPEMVASGIILQLCNLFNSTKVEKIVRVFLLLFDNLQNYGPCLEIIADTNVNQTIKLLEYDKWKDKELYGEIVRIYNQIELKIRKLTNIDRYLSELKTGALKWSQLHTEQFWSQNYTFFERDEFSNIARLVELLNSTDNVILAIACFDIGEFARRYHNGKQICKKFNVKARVMELTSSKDRDVAREAMLCLQKLIVHNWQQVARKN